MRRRPAINTSPLKIRICLQHNRPKSTARTSELQIRFRVSDNLSPKWPVICRESRSSLGRTSMKHTSIDASLSAPRFDFWLRRDRIKSSAVKFTRPRATERHLLTSPAVKRFTQSSWSQNTLAEAFPELSTGASH